MKKGIVYYSFIVLTIFMFSSCEPGIVIEKPDVYKLEIEELSKKTKAPSLQSFVHGVSGDEWLLFAGRTNQKNDNGGLHNIDGDYADTSFPPTTFNDKIFVYNLKNDSKVSITLNDLKQILKTNFPKNAAALEGFEHVFRNSNSLVKQKGDFLFVVGGYGPKDFNANSKKIGNYITYNHVARIHVPSLISLVNGNYDAVDKAQLFAFGRDKTNTLVSTGGELHTVDGTFYLVMGHCFGTNCTPFQKYVDATYPFTVLVDTSKTANNIHKLNISISNAISDVSDPKGAAADNMSVFRRRDGPIVPALFKSPVSNKIQEGIAVYSGVFKAGNDENLQAWNDAIYIHPNFANQESRLYTYDKTYNQKNYNVYASPSFVMYNADKEMTHTYILGGIGDGKSAKNGNLSGFTNTGMRIDTKITTNFKNNTTITSTNKIISENIYLNKDKNDKPFYGAEAILFPNSNLKVVEISNGKNSKGQEKAPTITEVFDMSKFDGEKIIIGHIFGGIEAFESNPASYGPKKSRASNKIWKVTLKKQ